MYGTVPLNPLETAAVGGSVETIDGAMVASRDASSWVAAIVDEMVTVVAA